MNLLDVNVPHYNDDSYNVKLIEKIKRIQNPSFGPIAILTMGSSGSGKSYTLKQFKYYKNFLIIDYDEIALQLPELLYNKQNGIYDRGFMHKNYSLISKITEDIFKKALSAKVNIICHSIIPSEERIKKLLKNGYSIMIIHKKDDPLLFKRRKERLLRTHLFTKIELVNDKDLKKYTYFDMDEWIVTNNQLSVWDTIYSNKFIS